MSFFSAKKTNKCYSAYLLPLNCIAIVHLLDIGIISGHEKPCIIRTLALARRTWIWFRWVIRARVCSGRAECENICLHVLFMEEQADSSPLETNTRHSVHDFSPNANMCIHFHVCETTSFLHHIVTIAEYCSLSDRCLRTDARSRNRCFHPSCCLLLRRLADMINQAMLMPGKRWWWRENALGNESAACLRMGEMGIFLFAKRWSASARRLSPAREFVERVDALRSLLHNGLEEGCRHYSLPLKGRLEHLSSCSRQLKKMLKADI